MKIRNEYLPDGASSRTPFLVFVIEEDDSTRVTIKASGPLLVATFGVAGDLIWTATHDPGVDRSILSYRPGVRIPGVENLFALDLTQWERLKEVYKEMQ